MIAEIGYGTLFIALLVAVYGIIAVLYGKSRHKEPWINSARFALMLVLPLLSLSMLFLITLLVNGHYEIQYVYQVVDASMPYYLRLSALWGGQAGSLLFWTWTLSVFAFAIMLRKWERDRDFLPWVILIILILFAFFISLSLFGENPFVRFWQLTGGEQVVSLFKPSQGVLLSPSDGHGLNPLLRHPGMIFHPPLLYLGFSAFMIPYAFAMAALFIKRVDDRWIRIIRPWTIIAWLFLTGGLLLGSRWAYDVLGWGGYWAWDPVENAALIPWLLGTAFIHSVMIQEKSKLFKRWNMILILLTFSMVIYGVFLTRSGILSSVHSFAESRIGIPFFVFIVLMFCGSLALFIRRWADLKSVGVFYSLFSREALFLFNNLILFGLWFIVFLGINFPIFSELFTGQKMTVGPSWYEQTTGPLFAVLIFLMAIAPLSAWGYSTAKSIIKAAWLPLLISLGISGGVYSFGIRNWFALIGIWLVGFSILTTLYDFINGYISCRKNVKESVIASLFRLSRRNRRRYGGYIVHIGVALMSLGIIGIEFFQTETQINLSIGEAVQIDSYSVQLISIAEFDLPDGRNVARAVMKIEQDQKDIAEIHPRRDYYYRAGQAISIPGRHSTLLDELYVVLVDWEPINNSQATFKIYRNLFINWLWFGGVGMILGGLIAVMPWSKSNR